MEDALENLKLLDEEEEVLQEDEGAVCCVHHLCLVGRCLTDSVVHFPSLRNTMADLWHPIGGIYIFKIGEKQYFFQFFHEVDIERVIGGIPWFFNNHLLILQKVSVGVNPAVMEINHMEFWIQYDTSILNLRLQIYLRIRVCLNVTAPLKHKKKVLVGKTMVVYARFKYEKLMFGWDLSLCAVVRRQNIVVSRWLRVANGSPCSEENLAGVKHGNSLNVRNDLGLNSRGFVGNLNPNLIPLGSAQIQGVSKTIKGRDGCIDILNANGLVYRAMELVLDEENDPIALSESKKRQRIMESSRVLMDANVGSGSMDVLASPDDQSSRAR
ncbi:hypothetical protein Goshw_010552 [Gossypium schwendimanii]|uniref:DUF4283 domain-containing protein n=1 Tax=Gossypium schwendimanii TaxID=34291 RepID=A0A7J9LF83_GOSSC|nr:hypothetical protein [Gossypium schwendimanii]